MAAEKSNEKLNATENTDAILVKEVVQHPQEVPFMMAVGTPVNINKSTLQGIISGYDLSEDKKTLSYIVDYVDDGENHQRAFLHNQIKAK